MDGLLAHKNVIENINLALYRISVIFLPPHSSDHPDDSNQTNQTIKKIRSLWQESAPDCTMSVFCCESIEIHIQ